MNHLENMRKEIGGKILDAIKIKIHPALGIVDLKKKCRGKRKPVQRDKYIMSAICFFCRFDSFPKKFETKSPTDGSN